MAHLTRMQMKKHIVIPTTIAITMIVVFSYLSSGLSLIVTFVPGVILAYIFYWMFCFKSNPNATDILPLYFLGIGFQMLHFAEEHATNFDVVFPALFKGQPYAHNLFVTFNMCAYFLFLIGGYAIYKGFKPLMIFAMFFIAYGMIGNCIGHISFAIMVKGYFSGLYSSFLNFFLSIILLKKLWQGTKPPSHQENLFDMAKTVR